MGRFLPFSIANPGFFRQRIGAEFDLTRKKKKKGGKKTSPHFPLERADKKKKKKGGGAYEISSMIFCSIYRISFRVGGGGGGVHSTL